MATNDSVLGVIFDLDGTLVDTIGDFASAVNTVLSAHGLPVFGLREFKTMVGDGFSTLVAKALGPELVADVFFFDSILAEAKSRYAVECLLTTKPFDGVRELLAELSAQGKVCAVLSNKPHYMSQTIVKALFPAQAFVSVLGERPGVPRKPHPWAALEIAQSAGIPPSSWAFVGDSGVDMKTGLAAGMMPWAALWGYRSIDELVDAGADLVFETPADLLASFRSSLF